MDERQREEGVAAREAGPGSLSRRAYNRHWVAAAGVVGAWVLFLLAAGRPAPGYPAVWQAVQMARQDPHRAWLGVQLIVVPDGAKTQPYLLEALRSDDEAARWVGLLGLAAVGEEEGFEAVFEYCAAARPETLRNIHDALRHQDPLREHIESRWGAAAIPIFVTDSGEEEEGKNAQRHRRYRMTYAARELREACLRKAPDQRAVGFLAAALGPGGDPRRASLAARVVEVLGPSAREARPALTGILARTDDPELAEWTVRAVVAIGGGEGARAAAAMGDRIEAQSRTGGRRLSPELSEAFGTGFALGLEPPAGRAAVDKLAAHVEGHCLASAASAMGCKDWQRTVKQLAGTLTEERRQVWVTKLRAAYAEEAVFARLTGTEAAALSEALRMLGDKDAQGVVVQWMTVHQSGQ